MDDSGVDISSLLLSFICQYRALVFPPVLSEPSHVPTLFLETSEEWIMSDGVELYLKWEALRIVPTDGPHLRGKGDFDFEGVSIQDLKGYREMLLPATLAGDTFFTLDNIVNWALPPFLEFYLAQSKRKSSISRASSFMDTLEISDNNNNNMKLPQKIMTLQYRVPPGVLPESITISDSDSDDKQKPKIPHTVETKPTQQQAKRTKPSMNSGAIHITSKLKVESIATLTSVPSRWSVPHAPAATIIDLSGDDTLLTKQSGALLTLDALIHLQDQESWGGSTGSKTSNCDVSGLADHPVKCRRAHLSCNGVDTCEFFDSKLFEGCERYEPDEDATRELWNHELDENEKEALLSVGILTRFYNRVMGVKCDIQCNGRPRVMPLRKCSKHGKEYFVGCFKWSKKEKFDHLYFPIPPNVDKHEFIAVMQSGGKLPNPETVQDKCALTVHPRLGAKKCPYTHVVDGVIHQGSIVNRKCPTELIIFIPIDCSEIHITILCILRPNRRTERQSCEVTIEAARKTGLTVRKLINGLVYEHSQRESKLLQSKQYIQTVMTKGEIQLAVTMHPEIVSLIHTSLYLCIDYTFKRVHGDMNEWEVVGFSERYKRLSGITTCDPLEILLYFLKTCGPHFERTLDELPKTIPSADIQRLKSIMGLKTEAEISAWHEFCQASTYEPIKEWYKQKIQNPWLLPSINRFLSCIEDTHWNLTPNHSNLVETAHAGRNAETGIGTLILTAILLNAAAIVETRKSTFKKTSIRDDYIQQYEVLEKEREELQSSIQASLDRTRLVSARVAHLKQDRAATSLSPRRPVLPEIQAAERELKDELDLHRPLNTCKKDLLAKITALRGGPLSGVRLQGRRVRESSGDEGSSVVEPALVSPSPSATQDDCKDVGYLSPVDFEPSTPQQGSTPVFDDVTSATEPSPLGVRPQLPSDRNPTSIFHQPPAASSSGNNTLWTNLSQPYVQPFSFDDLFPGFRGEVAFSDEAMRQYAELIKEYPHCAPNFPM
ncbi:hypothetical protein JAAARDRAFT_79892 [Jaapia argillacea MUCL 33604]|uniref:Uncharacterized protein n=1 Tax=Jaapia argillacea MUCL 33604 TaxID=933084 RepID=A0A067PL61_9AGAM|nr:hypothetical protein JAAARDRAFT_79892 [Jaapia argillacea MUCL 33604]